MINNANVMLGLLLLGLVSLILAMSIDPGDPVKPIHHEVASYSRDEESELLDLIDKNEGFDKPRLYHPKTAAERSAAIANVWSLDLKKPLKLAMR